MPIPKFDDLTLPLLELCAAVKECTIADAAELIADHFQLNESERRLRMPSGRCTDIHPYGLGSHLS